VPYPFYALFLQQLCFLCLASTFEGEGQAVQHSAVTFYLHTIVVSTVGGNTLSFTLHYFSLLMEPWQEGQ